MARVTVAEVQAIKPTTLDPTPFIQTATRLVDYYCVPMALPADLLHEVELYWSAHLVSIADPQVKQQRLGETAQTFAVGDVGMGLCSTGYGQVVVGMVPELMNVTTLKPAEFDVF